MNPNRTRAVVVGLSAVLAVLALIVLVAPAPPSLPGTVAGPSGAIAAQASPSPTGSPAPSTTEPPDGDTTTDPTASPEPAPSVTPPPAPPADVAIVPVTSFRTPVEAATIAEVRAALAGRSGARYEAVELVAAEADAILEALGVTAPADPARLVLARDAATLAADMAKHRKRLGFLRADQVGPEVRALGWGGKALFGVDRLKKAGSWSLTARLPATVPGAAPFDPRRTWTLVAGGDIMLDRGVAQTVTVKGRGVDFPFAGGTAEITGHTCCSSFGWQLPTTRRTGDAGAVRRFLKSADIAAANFENPAPDLFRYHTSGTTFSADPKLIEGLANAGIDVVSLANNHIGDAGRNGIIQTRRNVQKWGIAVAGAGKNLTEARKPALLEAGGVTVAVLGYDTIAAGYVATADRPGSARLTAKAVKADVAAARKAGADLVVVYPHWGTEYKATPFAAQQKLARAVIDAGADIVIGNHAHWAGAMEVYKGKPIWYALGNFVFDQTWSEPTMEGILLELTFRGTDLVQVRMRPHIILDKSQPNFLDPAGDGKVVLGQVYGASKGLLDW